MVSLFVSLFTIQQRYKYYFSCCISLYMCVFLLMRIYPSALFSLCAFFPCAYIHMRFFPVRFFPMCFFPVTVEIAYFKVLKIVFQERKRLESVPHPPSLKVEDSLGDKVARNENPCNKYPTTLLLLATFLAIFAKKVAYKIA